MRWTFFSEYFNASFTLLLHSTLVRDDSSKSATCKFMLLLSILQTV